ncbi:hypothetical protein ASF98_23455 [Arthrobacter sp. Leaf337]|nr:hypothetical protein ASF98_23455 [Arthrobacter sp. Leaf337]
MLLIRLHRLLRELIPGGVEPGLSADKAAQAGDEPRRSAANDNPSTQKTSAGLCAIVPFEQLGAAISGERTSRPKCTNGPTLSTAGAASHF